MLRLLKFLWTGTWHICKYDIPYTTVNVYDYDNREIPYKILEICRCKKCGNIKSFNAG